MEMGISGKVIGFANMVLNVPAFLKVDWSYLTSHWSTAVSCQNKFRTPPQIPTLLSQSLSPNTLHLAFVFVIPELYLGQVFTARLRGGGGGGKILFKENLLI